MRITCPNCRSEYAFDRDRVSGSGTKVKCSACAHLFTVFRPDQGPESIDDVRRLRESSEKSGPGLFFRQEGKTYPVRDLSTLQRWIIEKRVLATDQVSADAETWENVIHVAELRPFFDLIRQLRETRRELQYTRERLRGYVTGEHRQVSSDDGDSEPEVHATREVMEHVPADGAGDSRLVHLSDPGASPDPEDLVEPESAEFHAISSSEGYSEVVDSSTGDSRIDVDDSVEDDVESLRQRVVGHETPEPVDRAGDDAPSEDEQETAGISVGEAGPAADTADMVTAESPQVEPRGEAVETAEAPTEAELMEALTGEPQVGPIPRAARETMSRLAAEGIEEPFYDPSAQSVIVEPSLSGDEAAQSDAEDEPVELDQRAGPAVLGEGPSPIAWSADGSADGLESEDSVPPPVSFGEPSVGWGSVESEPGEDAPAPASAAQEPTEEPADEPADEPAEEPVGEPQAGDERPPPPPEVNWGSGSADEESADEESADDEEPAAATSSEEPAAVSGEDDEPSDGSAPDSTPVLEERIASMWDSMESGDVDFGQSQEPSPESPSGEMEQLGQEFERFERSFRESKTEGTDEDSVSTAAPAGDAWKSDDFDDQQFEFEDSADEEAEERSRLWFVIGALVLVLAIGGATWYGVRVMKNSTDRKLDWVVDEGGTEQTAGDATAGTPGETAADETGGDGAGEPGGDTAAEDAAADAAEGGEEDTGGADPPDSAEVEEATPEPPDEEPSEPPADVSDRPEPEREERTDTSDRPEPPSDGSAFELVDVGGGTDPAGEDHTVKGDELARKGQYAEAIQAYQKALDISSKDTRALRGLGWAYIEIGSAVQASEHFQRAVMLESMNAEAHYGLGLAYEQLGRRDQAINEYQTYIGLAPNGREATEVRILLRRLLEINP